MSFDPDSIAGLPVEQFRRFGIKCCYRLGCDRKDKRMAKALKRLERSLGPPPDEKLRRDALNVARSIHRELYIRNEVMRSISCTLICTCCDGPNITLIGNFEHALKLSENLSTAEIRKIESEMLQEVLAAERP